MPYLIELTIKMHHKPRMNLFQNSDFQFVRKSKLKLTITMNELDPIEQWKDKAEISSQRTKTKFDNESSIEEA